MEKIDDDIVIHPIRTSKEQEIPRCGLILVNPVDFNQGLQLFKEQEGEKRFLHNSNLYVNSNEDFFIAGPAIGAPVAVMTLEKLIALGAEKIYFYGWCGAIDKNYKVADVVIPSRAKSGEGTSKYYSDDVYSTPCKTMSGKLSDVLKKEGILANDAYLWTTDAPYRESRRFLAELHTNEKITSIDMEFSALCTVAQFREVGFAAVMTVSDEIWAEKWSTGFSRKSFKRKSRKILKILLTDPDLRE